MARRLTNLTFVLLLFLQLTLPSSVVSSQSTDHSLYQVSLAGTLVEIDLPFAVPAFIEPAPDDALQAATSARWEPFFEVSLSAETFASSLTGSSSAAGSSSADGLKTALHSLRAEQSPSAMPAHTIDFFGQPAASASNQVQIFLQPLAEEAVIIHEWVVQAEERSWILRVSYTPGQDFDESLLDQIAVRAVGPAPEAPPQPLEPAPAAADAPATSNLPTPPWWQGDCDTNYYYPRSSPTSKAYPLGGIYRGVKACGPRPWTGYKDVYVQFYPKAWGALEWECVELSMRYLYLAYNIPTYSGNGKDVVANYPGTRLVKIANGSVNKAPVAGDVLSYGSTGVGHTSVVSASHVDTAGNGTITIIEQNNSTTGIKTHTVSKWYVQASYTVSGWLHDPVTMTLLGPDNNVLVERNATFDMAWKSVPLADSYQLQLTGGPGLDEIGTTTATVMVLASSVPGGVYQWRVQAYKGNLMIATSEWRTIYRKYGTPGRLVVNRPTSTSASLSWGASSDAPDNIDGYHIYRNGVLIASTGPAVLTYTDSASTSRACYSVTAYKADLQSTVRGSCPVLLPFISK